MLLTNAINLIDGLDGLAAGIVAIAGGALFLFADRLFKAGYLDGEQHRARSSRSSRSACASASCRSTGNPAKIIMGDAGALFLGLLLAVPTITIGGRTDFAFSGNTYFFFAPLAIPVVILGVPDRRHGVLVRAPRLANASAGTRPTPTISTTGSCASATARAARS